MCDDLNPSLRARRKTERFQLYNQQSRPRCEVLIMSQKTAHVKLRCMECKAKFDSKYDAFDTSVITNVGQVLQNFIFCQRCGKRVSVVVFDIR
jgi:uncharacterized protein with PIN domain